MKMFINVDTVHLHREPVDFRKSINGLSIIVESEMALSPLSGALFVFCNKKRDKLKLLYWDKTGFALWYKRLEQEKLTGAKRREYCMKCAAVRSSATGHGAGVRR